MLLLRTHAPDHELGLIVLAFSIHVLDGLDRLL